MKNNEEIKTLVVDEIVYPGEISHLMVRTSKKIH